MENRTVKHTHVPKTLVGTVLILSFFCLCACHGAPVGPQGNHTPETIRFGVCADVHKDVMNDADVRLKTFVQRMNREKVDFIIQLGDFCRPYAYNQGFLDIWNTFAGPRYHVLGNHDMDGGFTREQTLAFWGVKDKYYSFNRGGYHFVVLDGNDKKKQGAAPGYPRYIGPQQVEWLKRDLAQADSPTLVFSHQSLENPEGVENARARRHPHPRYPTAS